MKRNYFWGMLLVALTFGACKDRRIGEPIPEHFFKNYISFYYQGEIELAGWTWPLTPPENPETTPISDFHFLPVNGVKYISENYCKTEFERLAERNGDTDFNQWLYVGPAPFHAWADNFSELHVTSNADWDEAHPAGTLLDDILRIRFTSYADFVHSGYDTAGRDPKSGGSTFHSKLISQLTAADMEMVECREYGPVVCFTSTPTKATLHTLTVEWTTVEGGVKTASITCTPEVEAPDFK